MQSPKSSMFSMPGQPMPGLNNPAHSVTKDEANRAALLPYETVLAEGLRGFLAELVMINGGLMVSYICNKQHGNVDDLIGSSMERRVKPGHLVYSNDAEVEFDWGEAPSVHLGMELCDPRLTTFFRVIFGAQHIGIDIRGIHFTEALGSPADNLRRFTDVVSDALLDG